MTHQEIDIERKALLAKWIDIKKQILQKIMSGQDWSELKIAMNTIRSQIFSVGANIEDETVSTTAE